MYANRMFTLPELLSLPKETTVYFRNGIDASSRMWTFHGDGTVYSSDINADFPDSRISAAYYGSVYWCWAYDPTPEEYENRLTTWRSINQQCTITSNLPDASLNSQISNAVV